MKCQIGMRVGYDSLRGAVHAKILEIYTDRWGTLRFKLETLGSEVAQTALSDCEFRKGMILDVDAKRCAPVKNFRCRGYHLYWIPVTWETP